MDAMAKGINFISVKKYVEMNYGEEMWHQLIESLSTEVKTVWNLTHKTGSDYPFYAFKEMISVMKSSLRTTRESEMAAVYEFIADESMSSMSKLRLRMSTPSSVIKNYPALWSSFFNAGTVDVPVASKGQGVVRFVLPEIFDDWLQPACLGFSKKAVEMAGGKDLMIQRTAYEKRKDNLFESRYELRWKE